MRVTRRAGSPGGIARTGRAINDVNSAGPAAAAEGGVCRVVWAATIRAAASKLDGTEIQATGLARWTAPDSPALKPVRNLVCRLLLGKKRSGDHWGATNSL